MGPWQRYGFVVAVCWPAHAVPNSTSGPHLAPYPLSRFSRVVPPRLVALLHAVSRFIRIFAPGDVTLSCLGEEEEGEKRREGEEDRAVSRKLERDEARARGNEGEEEKRVRREILVIAGVLSRPSRNERGETRKDPADKNFSN